MSAATAVFQNVLLLQLTKKINELVSDPREAAKIIAKALDSTEYVNEALNMLEKQ